MSGAIRYRLYEPADREGLLALFRSVYGDEAPRKTSAWRYLDRPLRRALISVAEVDGRIVGTQPSYEVLVKMRGEQLSGAMFLDVMTHPEHRGRGIFRGVVEHLRRECHERGMAILLTTPNADAARGFSKLAAWRCLGELTPFVRPVALFRLLRPRPVTTSGPSAPGGPRRSAGMPSATRASSTVAEMDSLDRPITEVWRGFADVAPTMLTRDTDYIAWRFSNRGPRHYRLFAEAAGPAYQALAVAGDGELLGRPVVFLSELLASPAQASLARRLLDAVAQHARASGAGAIVAYHTPASAVARLLRRSGFWPVMRPLRPRPYTVWMATSLDEHRAADIRDLASWHMSMGDSDLA
jgi:GNAT superfamily N-acetyltransferase